MATSTDRGTPARLSRSGSLPARAPVDLALAAPVVTERSTQSISPATGRPVSRAATTQYSHGVRQLPAFKLIPHPVDDAAAALSGFRWAGPEVGTRHRLGGEPSFIGIEQFPGCPSCLETMTFYGQLDSINDDFCLADVGVVQVFVCVRLLHRSGHHPVELDPRPGRAPRDRTFPDTSARRYRRIPSGDALASGAASQLQQADHKPVAPLCGFGESGADSAKASITNSVRCSSTGSRSQIDG